MKPVLRSSDVENLAGVDTGRHHLSHSKLAVFLACRRKYDLHYVQRLEPISRPRPLTLGSAFQTAIEFQNPMAGVYELEGYGPCRTCSARGTVPVLHPTTVMGMAGGIASGECPDCDGKGYTGDRAPIWTQEAEDRRRVDQAIVTGAARLYMARWPKGVSEHREFEFKVRLRNPWTGAYSLTYDLLGYADAVADLERAVTRELGTETLSLLEQAQAADVELVPFELVENKLVGQVTPVKIKQIPLDRQVALMRYGIWRATGRPVLRVRYRFVKKPAIKQRQGRGDARTGAESLDEFCERIVADYAERPDFYSHEEDPHFIGMDDLLRLECELWEWAEDLRAKHRPLGRRGRRLFDRNTSHCTDFGGCHFLPICTGDPDAHALFQVRPRREQVGALPEAFAD